MTQRGRTRELVDYPTHQRYIRRDKSGRFTTQQVSVKASLKADARKKAKRKVRSGFGDRGDRKR